MTLAGVGTVSPAAPEWANTCQAASRPNCARTVKTTVFLLALFTSVLQKQCQVIDQLVKLLRAHAVDTAWPRERHGNSFHDHARPAAHHDHAIGQKERFV